MILTAILCIVAAFPILVVSRNTIQQEKLTSRNQAMLGKKDVLSESESSLIINNAVSKMPFFLIPSILIFVSTPTLFVIGIDRFTDTPVALVILELLAIMAVNTISSIVAVDTYINFRVAEYILDSKNLMPSDNDKKTKESNFFHNWLHEIHTKNFL